MSLALKQKTLLVRRNSPVDEVGVKSYTEGWLADFDAANVSAGHFAVIPDLKHGQLRLMFSGAANDAYGIDEQDKYILLVDFRKQEQYRTEAEIIDLIGERLAQALPEVSANGASHVVIYSIGLGKDEIQILTKVGEDPRPYVEGEEYTEDDVLQVYPVHEPLPSFNPVTQVVSPAGYDLVDVDGEMKWTLLWNYAELPQSSSSGGSEPAPSDNALDDKRKAYAPFWLQRDISGTDPEVLTPDGDDGFSFAIPVNTTQHVGIQLSGISYSSDRQHQWYRLQVTVQNIGGVVTVRGTDYKDNINSSNELYWNPVVVAASGQEAWNLQVTLPSGVADFQAQALVEVMEIGHPT